MSVVAVCLITGISAITPTHGLQLTADCRIENSAIYSVGVGDLDPNSYRLNEDIEEAIKAVLQASPNNITFGSDDTVRLVPAHS